jgi:ankyrin repeat protein
MVVEELLQWGAYIDARDNDCSTPLSEASLHGQTKVVELLLEHRADVNTMNSGYRIPLHLAVFKRHFDIAWTLLIYGADPNARDDEHGGTPLHLASTCGWVDIVNLLLDRGASVNSQDGHGKTPLHMAASSGHLDAARWLIRHGADVNARDYLGQIPFSIALETGRRKVARLLSDSGA